MATVLFHRTDSQFWKMTPRQLMALCEIHTKINGGESQTKEVGTAQDLAALARMRRSDG